MPRTSKTLVGLKTNTKEQRKWLQVSKKKSPGYLRFHFFSAIQSTSWRGIQGRINQRLLGICIILPHVIWYHARWKTLGHHNRWCQWRQGFHLSGQVRLNMERTPRSADVNTGQLSILGIPHIRSLMVFCTLLI